MVHRRDKPASFVRNRALERDERCVPAECDVWGIPNMGFDAQVFAHLAGPARVERLDMMAEDHPLMDAYWQDKSAKLESIKVPAYVVTDVVTDLHRMGTFEGYRRLGSKDKWLRVDNRQEWTDQYDPANEADLLKFFDYFLRGADNGWHTTPKVRIAVLDPGGEDRLNVPYPSWPLDQTQYERLYLGTDQHLQSSPPVMAVQASYIATTGQCVFTYRFIADTQLTGYLKAHLWFEAEDASEADIFALVEKLRKLNPTLSTDFLPIQSFDEPQTLHPGKIVPVDIAIMPASEVFHGGQQLRLTISGHEFLAPPATQANSGVLAFMGPMPPLATKNAGVHIIHTGGAYKSFLQIPVIPLPK